VRILEGRIGKRIAAAKRWPDKAGHSAAFEAKSNYELKLQIHIDFARWHHCGSVFRFLSGAGIDHDYDTANSNTTPYEPRRGAEDSAGNTVTDAVKFYSQSQAETFKVALRLSALG
jgi:hypothetical protein